MVYINPRTTGASGAWPSANKPIAIPFRLSSAMVVRRLGWRNGSSPGSNWDIGIYDAAFNRKVSSGSTAGSGVYQNVDVTDTALPPGKYYLAIALNATTANRAYFINTVSGTALVSFTGVMDSGTNAFPLPDPLTNMVAAATFVRVPVFFIYGRDAY